MLQEEDLPNLKEALSIFLSKASSRFCMDRNDKEDTLQQELRREVSTSFADFKKVNKDIELLFQHLKYYDKLFKEPRVITLTNNVAL